LLCRIGEFSVARAGREWSSEHLSERKSFVLFSAAVIVAKNNENPHEERKRELKYQMYKIGRVLLFRGTFILTADGD
jgi:hypothetical protein